MIRLYMDENVQGDIVRGLRERGVEILTVQEDGRASSSDPEVLNRATELGRVLFSRDTDLIAEATRRQRSGEKFTGVIYARQNVLSVGKCIEDLELLALAGLPEDFANQVQYLPL
ncbi:MAG TPA: DUF5615 family PIN-like protein [Chthonomonadaceae bacterium]|nr:DUF5615 family PIN-like protein [Chthonomonadaceae bacterium]